jgi:hypothetical protein
MHCSLACLLASSLGLGWLGVGSPWSGALPQDPPPVPPAPVTTQAPAATPAKDAADPKARPRPADAAALLATFARMPGLEASYDEEKHLALLALPLRSKGRILFLPPGHLLREVTSPEPGTVLLTPDELVVRDRERQETIDLKRSDTVRLFTTSLVQVFAGDQAALAKAFTIEFRADEKTANGWTLLLVPKDARLQKITKHLLLRGLGEAVTTIEVHDPNGDRTVTQITAADVARRFDADERRRWFRIEPR